MTKQFRHLFTPLRIGNVTVRNRILVTGHTTLYAENNMISERHVHYYEERAKGGVGLMITEQQGVLPTATGGLRAGSLGYDERVIPRYRQLTEAVHRYGAKIFAQLWHSGYQTVGDIHDNWQPVWAPSPLPSVRFREWAKEMEPEDIEALIEGFARTARNAREGGMDGVEIHAAHTYGLAQFLSPLTNWRSDEYGGSEDNRLRIILRIIERVRREVGDDFVVGIRLSGDELVDGGLTLEDTRRIVAKLAASGQLDFFDMSIGSYFTPIMVAPMSVPPGYAVHTAAAIKEVVPNLPVFTVGRINDPALAERILANGQADMIGMTRAHIADPELANKARAGRADDIRPCVACNQRCIAHLQRQLPVTCIYNPTAGREKQWGIGSLRPARRKKKVMVIGGGPAGMETARVAAMRGHRVILYEKSSVLGGQVNLAAKLPHRAEFGEIARWLERQVRKVGVRVHLGTEATVETVNSENPDVVVVATGSRPLRTGYSPAIPGRRRVAGIEQAHVLSGRDVLEGEVPVGEHTLVIDDEGNHAAAGIVEFVAERSKQVTWVTRFPYVGYDLVKTHELGPTYQRLLSKGVEFVPNTVVEEIGEGTVVLANIYDPGRRREIGVDTVVLAGGSIANNELYRRLKGQGVELHAVGDCVAPRDVAMAVYEGHKLGRAL